MANQFAAKLLDALAQKEGRFFTELEQDFFKKVRPTSLIKRFATPGEVAAMVVYVAIPVARATTCAALRVDGGVISRHLGKGWRWWLPLACPRNAVHGRRKTGKGANA